MKLTTAQKRLLVEIAEGPIYCVDFFKPAQKLIAHGFAAWVRDDGRNLAITQEGRKALQAPRQRGEG